MPGLSGLELLREIRNLRILENVPIVILTSDDDVEVEIELVSAGANAFVTKNEDPRVLGAHVDRLLSGKAQKAASA